MNVLNVGIQKRYFLEFDELCPVLRTDASELFSLFEMSATCGSVSSGIPGTYDVAGSGVPAQLRLTSVSGDFSVADSVDILDSSSSVIGSSTITSDLCAIPDESSFTHVTCLTLDSGTFEGAVSISCSSTGSTAELVGVDVGFTDASSTSLYYLYGLTTISTAVTKHTFNAFAKSGDGDLEETYSRYLNSCPSPTLPSNIGSAGITVPIVDSSSSLYDLCEDWTLPSLLQTTLKTIPVVRARRKAFISSNENTAASQTIKQITTGTLGASYSGTSSALSCSAICPGVEEDYEAFLLTIGISDELSITKELPGRQDEAFASSSAAWSSSNTLSGNRSLTLERGPIADLSYSGNYSGVSTLAKSVRTREDLGQSASVTLTKIGECTSGDDISATVSQLFSGSASLNETLYTNEVGTSFSNLYEFETSLPAYFFAIVFKKKALVSTDLERIVSSVLPMSKDSKQTQRSNVVATLIATRAGSVGYFYASKARYRFEEQHRGVTSATSLYSLDEVPSSALFTGVMKTYNDDESILIESRPRLQKKTNVSTIAGFDDAPNIFKTYAGTYGLYELQYDVTLKALNQPSTMTTISFPMSLYGGFGEYGSGRTSYYGVAALGVLKTPDGPDGTYYSCKVHRTFAVPRLKIEKTSDDGATSSVTSSGSITYSDTYGIIKSESIGSEVFSGSGTEIREFNTEEIQTSTITHYDVLEASQTYASLKNNYPNPYMYANITFAESGILNDTVKDVNSSYKVTLEYPVIFCSVEFVEEDIPQTMTLFVDGEVPAIDSAVAGSPAHQLGTAFVSSMNGFITGIQFYVSSYDTTESHTLTLFSEEGAVLSQKEITGVLSSGFNYAYFDEPVEISANTTYIVSRFCVTFAAVATTGFFGATARTRFYLKANATVIINPGRYIATDNPSVAPSTRTSTNYFVSPIFSLNG